MGSLKTLFCLTPLIIVAGVIFVAVKNSGILKTLDLHDGGYGNCTYLERDFPGPEDITAYNSSTLIFSHGDYAQIWALGLPKHEQNHIVAIFDADKASYRVQELTLLNYPKDLSFHPHGINVRKQTDGEYLYVFRILNSPGTMELDYLFTIFPDQKLWNGILNDLIVISDNHFLITSYQPVTDPLEGYSNLILFNSQTQVPNYCSESVCLTLFHAQYQNNLYPFLYIRNSLLQIACDSRLPNSTLNSCCRQQWQNYFTSHKKGITWDGKDNVYIADTLSNVVNHFKLVPPPEVLHYQGYIQNDGGIDNVEYDPITKNVYVGTFGKLIDHISMEEHIKAHGKMSREDKLDFWSIVNEFSADPTDPNYHQLRTIIRSNKINKGLSGAYKLGSNLWLASWGDPTMMVCQKVE